MEKSDFKRDAFIIILMLLFLSSIYAGGNLITRSIEDYKLNKKIKNALSKLETNIEFQERFLDKKENGAKELLAMFERHKPLGKFKSKVRGITNNGQFFYIVLKDGTYRIVAPTEEVRRWK